MLNADGTGTCDGCGIHLPNTGVAYAVIISGMDDAGEAFVAHLHTDPTAKPVCADRVITKTVLGNRTVPKLHRPEKEITRD